MTSFRLVLFYNGFTGLCINLIGVVFQYGEINDSGFFCPGIPCNKIAKRPHGLRTQMAALYNVVVEDFADSSLFIFSVRPVDKVHHGTEKSGIGHLAGYNP